MFNPDAPTSSLHNWAHPCEFSAISQKETLQRKGESEELTENRAGGRKEVMVGGGGVGGSMEGMNAAPVPSPMSQMRPG